MAMTTGEFSRAILEEIAALRKKRFVTQEEMASVVGLTQPAVSMRLRGQYPWNTEELDALAPLWGIDAFQLIARARKHVGIHPPTPLDPADMTVEQLESLPNTIKIPRKKIQRP